jgi:hypothetical protein
MGLGKKLKKAVVGGVKGYATGGWAGAAAGAAGGLLSGGGGGGSATSAQAPTFTPYAVTSGFGSSSIDPTKKTASYTLDPRLATTRDKFYAGADAAMPQQYQTDFGNKVSQYGMGLFDQAANLNLDAMTQDYFNKNLKLLEPARAAESSRLNDLQFSRGTTGMGVGMGTEGYVNPQQYALAMAREQQNQSLAMGAEDRSRAIQAEDFQRAGSLYGLGQSYLTQPYETANTLFGYGTNIENLGMGTMATGMNMGNIATTANQNAADINKGINQQNFLNTLYNDSVNRDTWKTIGDQINWGGLFGNSSSSGGTSSFVDPNTYGGQTLPGVKYYI